MKRQLNLTSQSRNEESNLPNEAQEEQSCDVPGKFLIVEIPDDLRATPQVRFHGTWTGRDIGLLPKFLTKAYHLHQAAKRKELNP